MARAAGGTSQRLKFAPATIDSRSRSRDDGPASGDSTLVKRSPLNSGRGFERLRYEDVSEPCRKQIHAKQNAEYDDRHSRPADGNQEGQNYARQSRDQHCDPTAVWPGLESEADLERALNHEEDTNDQCQGDLSAKRIEQKKHCGGDGQETEEERTEERPSAVDRERSDQQKDSRDQKNPANEQGCDQRGKHREKDCGDSKNHHRNSEPQKPVGRGAEPSMKKAFIQSAVHGVPLHPRNAAMIACHG